MKATFLACILAVLALPAVAAEPIDWQPVKIDTWKNFTRHHFTVDGRACWVAVPPKPRDGSPWAWCMEFPTVFDDRTGVAPLVENGFHSRGGRCR